MKFSNILLMGLCCLCVTGAYARHHHKKHVLRADTVRAENTTTKPMTNTDQAAVGGVRESLNNSNNALPTPFGQVSWPEISAHMFKQNGKVYSLYHGYKLELTLDSKLQDAAEKYLTKPNILSGATAIIEPKTGKILALSQSGGSRNADISVNSSAPAASLIKIVTASAAIEKRDLMPEDKLYYRGGCSHLQNNNWLIDSARDKQVITFSKAFGSSCNTIFARLALYDVGLSSLKIYAEKFMFNKPILSDLKLQTSIFALPDLDMATPQEVAEAGAGFGATKLSPVHAALLSATVSNHGIMMAPYLIEAAYDATNKEVYRAHPVEIGRIISAKTASKIETLMLATTSIGSGRRAFHKAGTRFDIDEIGGKTGTLSDPENRNIMYTWFSGIASFDTPNSIAIGTFISSSQSWIVRASAVAQTTLADFFKFEKNVR